MEAETLALYGCPHRKLKLAGRSPANRLIIAPMSDLCRLIWCAMVGLVILSLCVAKLTHSFIYAPLADSCRESAASHSF
jgi:hypothetical protein